ncbi:MAG: helix-turn-helix transcriptional regulator [Candidatus Gastranaerophilales bacterium]|nr:helix-turn-helix transcriptional regulator [Candidatus Gastranaerophilales bacterium]
MKNKSSAKVNNFLQKNNLHKKDFAQMIGVTLSYVYNLIDENIPFSTRSTTIERIAAVMGILPEDFEEYVIEDDPIPYNKNLEKLKEYIKKNNMEIVEFLKLFERKKRLKMVDILRGTTPLPIDFEELKEIKEILKINKEDFFEFWKSIFTEYLQKGGFDIEKNQTLLNCMLSCTKEA